MRFISRLPDVRFLDLNQPFLAAYALECFKGRALDTRFGAGLGLCDRLGMAYVRPLGLLQATSGPLACPGATVAMCRPPAPPSRGGGAAGATLRNDAASGHRGLIQQVRLRASVQPKGQAEGAAAA